MQKLQTRASRSRKWRGCENGTAGTVPIGAVLCTSHLIGYARLWQLCELGPALHHLAYALADVDAAICLAIAARDNNYTKPKLTTEEVIYVKVGTL